MPPREKWDAVPACLKEQARWVRWRLEPSKNGDKPRKVPKHPTENRNARTNDPATWGTFEDAYSNMTEHGMHGIGFVFSDDLPFYGYDIDGCIDDEGNIDQEAQEVITRLGTYAEVSPSGRGVKGIGIGKLDGAGGKTGRYEIYEAGRFFTITAWHIDGTPTECTESQEAINWFVDRHIKKQKQEKQAKKKPKAHACDVPISERERMASAYLAKSPAAVSGQGGHDTTFGTVVRVVRGFCLPAASAARVLAPWNARCSPPWTDEELEHKIEDAIAEGSIGWHSYLDGAPSGTLADIAQMRSDIERHQAIRAFAQENNVPAHVVQAEVKKLRQHQAPSDPANWRASLVWREMRDGTQFLEPCLHNIAIVLTYHEAWAGLIRYNEFTGESELMLGSPVDAMPGRWSGIHTAKTTQWLQSVMKLMVSTSLVDEAIPLAAHAVPFHPVREYLNGLVWDGEPRLDCWLELYCGATGSTYHRTIGRKWLISAVARVFEPGCKADHILILESPQGRRKSTLLETLFSRPWFTDEIDVLGSKDSAMQLRGVWCVEVSELDSMHRSETSRVKAFISRRVDRFRPPYGRHIIECPRQVVLAGSTNKEHYLSDDTGNRRFWSVACGYLDPDGIEKIRNQLWAEATFAYHAGETWYLDDPSIVQEAEIEQEARRPADAWEDAIDKAMATWPPGEDTTMSNIMHRMGIDTVRQGMNEQKRVASCLKKLGYRSIVSRDGNTLRRLWKKPGSGA